MEILFCLVGVAIFWLVILPALQAAGKQSRLEEEEAAMNRLRKK